MRLSRRLEWDKQENSWTESLANSSLLYDLTISNPTQAFDMRPYKKNIQEAFFQEEILTYQPSPLGLFSTRNFLAEALALPGGISPENILLTSSTSEAYSLLFKLLCNPGDEIAVPFPSYPLFEYLASLESVIIKPYRLEYIHQRGYMIDFSSLKHILTPRTKAIIYVHPNNPTGTGASEEEIASLNQLALYHDLAIIVDEVFADFWIERPSDVPQTWWNKIDGTLFILGGVSKSLLLPQMKLAWTLFHTHTKNHTHLHRAIELIGDTYLSPSIPIQCALPHWWKIKTPLTQMVKSRIRENLHHLRSRLENTPCRLHTYHGGWTTVVEFPRVVSEERLVQDLISKGVKLYPGYFFDFEREGFVVISLLTPSNELIPAIEILLELITKHTISGS